MGFKILYHVTKKKYVKKILKEGIKRIRSVFAVSPKEIALLRMSETHKQRLREKWKEQFVYLTDKRGAGVIARHWVECKHRPVILKVRIPEEWLYMSRGHEAWYDDYRSRNPKALEWVVDRVIPSKFIVAVYEYEGC
jgi:hypothetical protein